MARPIVSTDHILDNAADLVVRHGFDRVTTAEIAKAAGVAKGVLYLRFTSKDELLNALLDREFANAVRAVTELIDEDHCGGLLSRLYVHSLRAVHASPVLTAFYGAAHGESRAVTRLVRHRSGSRYPARELVGVAFLNELHRAGMIRADVDPATLARLLAVWSIGIATSAPHDDLDDLIICIGQLIERAIDADVTDSSPGKLAFTELARVLIDQAEQDLQSTGPSTAARRPARGEGARS